MKIHIPKFEPMLKANEHLAHEAFDIDLGDNVVEVVRCRDCKHWSEHGYKFCKIHSVLPDKYGSGVNVYTENDDFCSYGERREE